MRRTVLYIAVSLDGYIADKNGRVDWLSGHDPDEESEGSYSEFVQNIDTVVMGWETYHQVTTELSPDEWVYDDFITYVITHREKETRGKDIWICGGASIAQQLMRDGLIDRFYISVIPIVLGAGVRLLGKLQENLKLKLMETRSHNGIVELRYEKR